MGGATKASPTPLRGSSRYNREIGYGMGSEATTTVVCAEDEPPRPVQETV